VERGEGAHELVPPGFTRSHGGEELDSRRGAHNSFMIQSTGLESLRRGVGGRSELRHLHPLESPFAPEQYSQVWPVELVR
jgi:hypothetical protein